MLTKLTRNSLFIVTALGMALAFAGCGAKEGAAASGTTDASASKGMKAKDGKAEAPQGDKAPVGNN